MIPHRTVTTILSAASFIASAAAAAEPTASVVFVPSATTISTCSGNDLAVSLDISNPGRLEIGGCQVFVRFPALIFEAVRYEPLALTGNVGVAGPSPIGIGFRPCASSPDDGWSDLTGEDVVGVVATVFGDGKTQALTDETIEVGRLHFRPRGAIAPEPGATFSSNVAPCDPSFDAETRVFDPSGLAIPIQAPQPFSVVVTEAGPAARDFRCVERGSVVDLSWNAPTSGSYVGFRIYRDGGLLANLPLPGLVNYTDEAPPPSGTVTYDLVVVLTGGSEGCRLSCQLTRGGGATFIRGDANRDTRVNISDAVTVLDFLFRGGALTCKDAGDVDDTGVLNLTDPIVLLHYLFEPGQAAPPPAPFPNPGVDPTEDALDCAS